MMHITNVTDRREVTQVSPTREQTRRCSEHQLVVAAQKAAFAIPVSLVNSRHSTVWSKEK